MTREEAILAIIATWYQRDQEFCVGSEDEESADELYAALRAIGVTDQELMR